MPPPPPTHTHPSLYLAVADINFTNLPFLSRLFPSSCPKTVSLILTLGTIGQVIKEATYPVDTVTFGAFSTDLVVSHNLAYLVARVIGVVSYVSTHGWFLRLHYPDTRHVFSFYGYSTPTHDMFLVSTVRLHR